MINSLDEMKKAVAATVGGKPLVVDFKAEWCNPCKQIGPIYKDMIVQYPELVMRQCDMDAVQEVGQEYQVTSLPTFKVFKNGTEVDSMSGTNPQGLRDLLNRAKA